MIRTPLCTADAVFLFFFFFFCFSSVLLSDCSGKSGLQHVFLQTISFFGFPEQCLSVRTRQAGNSDKAVQNRLFCFFQ